jgi:hypothetical protein
MQYRTESIAEKRCIANRRCKRNKRGKVRARNKKSFAVKEKEPQSFRRRDRNNATRCAHLASFTDTVYKDQKWQTSQ